MREDPGTHKPIQAEMLACFVPVQVLLLGGSMALGDPSERPTAHAYVGFTQLRYYGICETYLFQRNLWHRS